MGDLIVLTGAAAMACGLVAGVFLTFSDFIMKALAATEPAAGIEAMQQINRKVFKTAFMVLLIGMAIIAPVFAIYGAVALPGPVATWLIAAGVIYTVGVFGVTVVFNVPRNNRLDRLNHLSREGAAYWPIYVGEWSRWNSVRTAGSAAAAICYLAACAQSAQAAVA